MKRNLMASAVATTFGFLLLVPSADAFTSLPVWKCRASAGYSSVNGGPRVEPVVANGKLGTTSSAPTENAQCAEAETGGGNLATPLGIPAGSLSLSTAQAKTTITPELGKAIDQKISAFARVNGTSIGTTPILGVTTAGATGSCTPGSLTPNLQGASNAVSLLGANQDALATALGNLLNATGLVKVTFNEQIRTANSLTVRAAHIIVPGAAGAPPLLDLVVGEAKVGFDGPVCDPTKQGGPGPDLGRVCPLGSVLDTTSNPLVCIIPGSSGSTFGTIIVGRPFAGPSGGTVVPIDIARKRFGNNVCLRGNSAPKFAIIGTNGPDRITGTNKADRILALGGKDAVSGGRGSDCIDGGTGSDNLSGSLGNDKIYGRTG
ncbi:MAG: hypothetical protein LC777_00890, partial [Actinobacteria bacterium]|nr:hypothetical protein [Actinomycetota bacterium]